MAGKTRRWLINLCSSIVLPPGLCQSIDKMKADECRNNAIDFTFGDINEKSRSAEWMEFVASRAILSTTNQFVDDINNICLNKLPGEEIIVASADSTSNPNDATHYPVEYINSLQTSGIPPHRLVLKKNAVAMLLRNLNISGGLCNGKGLIIEDIINDRLLKATIANGEGKGRTVLIPKILMQPADESLFGFEWQRIQFPVRIAFAMTIHKSQGQTLNKVGVWLQEPCFGHGQLYVAASRVGNPDNIKFFVKRIDGSPDFTTNNIVYHEYFQYHSFSLFSFFIFFSSFHYSKHRHIMVHQPRKELFCEHIYPMCEHFERTTTRV